MPEFNLDPNAANSFQDKLAMLRQSLPPTVTANLPPIPGQPVEQLPPPSPLPEPQAAVAPATAPAPVGESGPALASRLSAELKYAQDNNVSLMEARRSLQNNAYANVPPGTFGPSTMAQSAGGETQPVSAPTQPAPWEPEPVVPAQPGSVPANKQRADLDQAINTVPHTIGKPGDPTLTNLQEQISKISPKILERLLAQATALEPAKLHGPDVFGRGGILGTGVEPIDVLAFALGIGATWNLPQAQAQANAFEIAGWPSKFKDNQRKAGGEFMSQVASGMNALSGASNAIVGQQKQQDTQNQIAERNRIAEGYDAVGRHADAAAMRAGQVSEHIALNKEKTEQTRLPPNIADTLGIISASNTPMESVPQQLLSILGNPPDQATFMKRVRDSYAQLLLSRQSQPTPGGEVVIRTPSGPQLYNGPIYYGQDGQVYPARPPQPNELRPVPQQPVQPSAPVPPQPGQQSQVPGTGSLIAQASASQHPSDQWVARNAGYLPQNTVAQANRLFAKNLDAGERQKMIAQLATHSYAQDLSAGYEEMLKSYGGEDKYKLGHRLRLGAMQIGSQIGDPNTISLMFTKMLRQMAQEGAELTPQAIAFSNLYSQSQAFAKGSLNDTGNVATSERDMFRTMIGYVEDKPNTFRNNILIFQRQVAQNYNKALLGNQLKRTDGFDPLPVPDLKVLVGSGGKKPPANQPIDKSQWSTVRPPTSEY